MSYQDNKLKTDQKTFAPKIVQWQTQSLTVLMLFALVVNPLAQSLVSKKEKQLLGQSLEFQTTLEQPFKLEIENKITVELHNLLERFEQTEPQKKVRVLVRVTAAV